MFQGLEQMGNQAAVGAGANVPLGLIPSAQIAFGQGKVVLRIAAATTLSGTDFLVIGNERRVMSSPFGRQVRPRFHRDRRFEKGRRCTAVALPGCHVMRLRAVTISPTAWALNEKVIRVIHAPSLNQVFAKGKRVVIRRTS